MIASRFLSYQKAEIDTSRQMTVNRFPIDKRTVFAFAGVASEDGGNQRSKTFYRPRDDRIIKQGDAILNERPLFAFSHDNVFEHDIEQR
jgi:hypothetical protein